MKTRVMLVLGLAILTLAMIACSSSDKKDVKYTYEVTPENGVIYALTGGEEIFDVTIKHPDAKKKAPKGKEIEIVDYSSTLVSHEWVGGAVIPETGVLKLKLKWAAGEGKVDITFNVKGGEAYKVPVPIATVRKPYIKGFEVVSAAKTDTMIVVKFTDADCKDIELDTSFYTGTSPIYCQNKVKIKTQSKPILPATDINCEFVSAQGTWVQPQGATPDPDLKKFTAKTAASNGEAEVTFNISSTNAQNFIDLVNAEPDPAKKKAMTLDIKFKAAIKGHESSTEKATDAKEDVTIKLYFRDKDGKELEFAC